MARSSRNSALSPPVFSGSCCSESISSCSLSNLSAALGRPASSALRISFVLSEWPAQPASSETPKKKAPNRVRARSWPAHAPPLLFMAPLSSRDSNDGFGDRGLVLEQDLTRLDFQHLNEHEVLNATLAILPFVAGEDLPGYHVARADLLTPGGDLARVERPRVLLANLGDELALLLHADHAHVTGVDQRRFDVADQG